MFLKYVKSHPKPLIKYFLKQFESLVALSEEVVNLLH